MGVMGKGWADVNVEFVGVVRFKKLLAGKLKPSSVREKGLGFVSSISADCE